MAEDVLVAVKLRNDFYRDNYRRVVLAIFLLLVVILAQAGVIYYLLTHRPLPVYFATTNNGRVMRILPVVPLDEPNMPNSALQQWATEAATAAYTYDFVNYRAQLQAASEYFTTEGWRSFLSELESTRNLLAVQAKKLVVSAVVTRAPVILEQRNVDGVYAWRIQMPMVITYQSASESTTSNTMVTLTVNRVSTVTSPRGIGISQFIVGEQSSYLPR
jgi:intracellular multiplication protein IcmL